MKIEVYDEWLYCRACVEMQKPVVNIGGLYICVDCLRKALKLIEEESDE